MNCNLCHRAERLVKSHIIPKSFFVDKDDPRPGRLIGTRDRGIAKRIPIGVYSEIVCGDCEASFGAWDDYGYKLLLGGGLDKADEVSYGGELLALELRDFDYSALKLFLLSVLWRASASSHPFYGKVQLGALQGRLAARIRSRDPGTVHDWSTVIAQFDEQPHGTLDPHPERYDGIRYYRIHLDRYVAYVKADSQPSAPSLEYLALGPERPLRVVSRPYRGSSEMRAMLHTASVHVRLRTALRGR